MDRPPGPRPLVVGVAGGTGSGKSTIAARLAAALPPGGVATINHDSYYRDLTGLDAAQREAVNFDHPDSLENELLAEHLRELRAGRAVQVPLYDFKSHTRRPDRRTVEPAAVVLLEGILVFAVPELRGLMDVKVFVDTDADIRVFRRIRRDLEQRGRTFAAIREQYYATVRPMHLQFVEPSKRWADLIIPEGGQNEVAIDVLVARLRQVGGQG